MKSIINFIYEHIQESKLIQRGRENSQTEVEQIVKRVTDQKQLQPEELSDLLYGLVLTAEKAGFRSGFISGAKLISELRFPREI